VPGDLVLVWINEHDGLCREMESVYGVVIGCVRTRRERNFVS